MLIPIGSQLLVAGAIAILLALSLAVGYIRLVHWWAPISQAKSLKDIHKTLEGKSGRKTVKTPDWL